MAGLCRARLRVDADRYSFIQSDLHRLLLAGLSGALRNIPYVILGSAICLAPADSAIITSLKQSRGDDAETIPTNRDRG
jgi:hypothetical protein